LRGGSPEGGSGENLETAIKWPKNCRRWLTLISELDRKPEVSLPDDVPALDL
jgi:hypothetical protein